MALKRTYKKEVFIRSLVVSLIAIIATLIISQMWIQNIKNDIINNVKVSGEYIIGKIETKLVNQFGSMENPVFVLARKTLTPQEVGSLIEENAKDISKESIENIAIWTKDETGRIVNKYHSNTSYNGKDLYGMMPEDVLTSETVKDYFNLKIENKWLEDNFDKIGGYQIEDMKTIVNNKIRNYGHAVKKIEISGKSYILDLQYSKRSIADVRFLKEAQKVVIIAIAGLLMFLTIFALILDRNLLMHVLVVWVLIFTIYPLAWVIGLSFQKSNALGGTNLNPIPTDATWDNYIAAVMNMQVTKDEGIVMEDDGRLYLSVSKDTEADADPIQSSNIKTVYNVFDPERKNLWPSEVKLVKEKKVDSFEYNGEIKETVQYRYVILFKNKPTGDKTSNIYNVEYYKYQNTYFGTGMLNSIMVSLATAVVGMMLSSAAAYAFSRFRFPGKGGFMMSFLVTQMFPGTMMIIPLYVIFSNLGLINTFQGLILAYSITALPFNIWNLKGFFDTIPKELEEAALIDGCSASQTFYIIVLPLSLPALAISSLFSFMASWNEYIMAATFLNEEVKYTIPVVIKMLVGSNSVNWPMFATMSVLVSIPVVIVFLMSQKYLVGGLTAGGVKG